jgi:hypothetical protein
MPNGERLSHISVSAYESPRIWGRAVDLAHAAKFKGQLLGHGRLKGECATGVQVVFARAKKPLGLTRTWKQGKKVRGGKIRPGVAIASFRNGTYSQDHAAVLIEERPDGLWVWDQFNTTRSGNPKPWGKRLLRFSAPAGDHSNNGNHFYTIE